MALLETLVIRGDITALTGASVPTFPRILIYLKKYGRSYFGFLFPHLWYFLFPIENCFSINYMLTFGEELSNVLTCCCKVYWLRPHALPAVFAHSIYTEAILQCFWHKLLHVIQATRLATEMYTCFWGSATGSNYTHQGIKVEYRYLVKVTNKHYTNGAMDLASATTAVHLVFDTVFCNSTFFSRWI